MIYLTLLIIPIVLLMVVSVSVEDLRHELTEWIRIGIGDDIIRMPDNRPEYASIVSQMTEEQKHKSLETHQKVNHVLGIIERECKVPRLKRFLRPLFWRLVWIALKRQLTKLRR